MNPSDLAFSSFLSEIENNRHLRFLRNSDTSNFINFSSNDYLCLSKDVDLIKSAYLYVQKYGAGGAASRLITENQCYHEIENFIAKIKKKESALIFPSGYQLNSTVIPSLISIFKKKYGKIDLFCDRLNHASIQHGLTLSGEPQNRYRHQDLNHLEDMLKKSNNFKFVITETIFSMDGTMTDMKNLIDLKKKYNFFLYIDDAHSFGIYGDKMLGITEGFEDDIDVIMGTFSKAVGGQGGYLAAKKIITDSIVNSAMGFICTTAISPFLIGFAMESIKKFPSLKKNVNEMIELSNYTRELFSEKIKTGGSSHIIPILSNEKKLTEIKNTLLNGKVLTYIIRPPTVLTGLERIRLSLNLSIKKSVIDFIYSAL